MEETNGNGPVRSERQLLAELQQLRSENIRLRDALEASLRGRDPEEPLARAHPVDLLHRAFEASPFPVMLWRREDDGTVVLAMANSAAKHLSRGQIDRFLGVPLGEFFQHDPAFAARIQDAFASGDHHSMEGAYVTHTTGVDLWIRATAVKIDDRYVLDAMADLTSLRLARQALEESEVRFRYLTENASDIIYLINLQPSFQFRYINPAIAAVTGYEPEAFYRDPELAGTLIHPEDRARFREALLVTEAGASMIEPVMARASRPDGSVAWLEHRMIPIWDGEQEIVALEGVARDVTESVRDAGQAQQTIRDKELLLRELHHRVKNSLTIVSSLLELQIQSLQDPSLRTALKQSQDRILSVGRLYETQYRSVQLGPVDMDAYLALLGRRLGDSYATEQVHIVSSAEGPPWPPDLALHVGLIVTELVTNALKHAFSAGSGAQGTVRITLDTNSDYFELVVSDDGVGMPEEIEVPKLTALGLEIVKLLTAQVDGEIRLTSSPGAGTRIAIRAPLGGRPA